MTPDRHTTGSPLSSADAPAGRSVVTGSSATIATVGESLRVLKFGGSSLRDSGDLVRVVNRIASRSRPVVVVSALNGVTDQLIDLLEMVERDPAEAETAIDAMRDYHLTVLERALGHRPRSTVDELTRTFDTLEDLLHSCVDAGEVTPETRDAVVSYGERLSTRLVAAVCRSRGINAQARDADQIGIVTDGRFGAATADYERTRLNLHATLKSSFRRGIVPIVTGYFGRDREGHVTTFGRGGSDYSGAVLARCLDASTFEIWKDVDGVLSIDPNRLSSARPIPYLTYDEAGELARLGAHILHPRTVDPLQHRNIPIIVKNTHDPTVPGTRIGPGSDEPPALRVIVVRDGVASVALEGEGPAEGFVDGLRSSDVEVHDMGTDEECIELLIDGGDVGGIQDVLDGLDLPPERTSIDSGYSVVSIVGSGVDHRGSDLERFHRDLQSLDIDFRDVAVGSPEFSQSIVVATDEVDTAVRYAHDMVLAQPSRIVSD